MAQEHLVPLGPDFDGVALGCLEWGAGSAGRTILCVHGLTRNAHDFDALAPALARHGARVIAVDVAGRGRSSWLADPQNYRVETYAAHLARLMDVLGLGRVDWVGTSMGGIIGMVLAAAPDSRIDRLVLNDIGPAVDSATLAHIRSYLGLDLMFRDLGEVEAHLRTIHAGFGRLTDAQWAAMARTSSRGTPEGLQLHYDPAIRAPFMADTAGGIDLWPAWDAISCPTLVLHGADSPLLTGDILAEMRRRRPEIEVVTFAGVGHAPALMAADQIDTIARWLGL
ncbi:MAG: alpha/beta fold hydrolase [Geminicoccaceae bacterium]